MQSATDKAESSGQEQWKRQEWNNKKNHCCHLSFKMRIPVKIYDTRCFPLLLLKSGFGAEIFGIKSRQNGNARYGGKQLDPTKTVTKWVSRERGGGKIKERREGK